MNKRRLRRRFREAASTHQLVVIEPTEVWRAVGYLDEAGYLKAGCPPIDEPDGWRTVYVREDA